MCGIFCSNSDGVTMTVMDARLRHRGDRTEVKSFKDIHLGLNRLQIWGGSEARQPLETPRSLIAFNGEIYNHSKLPGETEIDCIENLMHKYPNNFERFLDGYYAIVRVNKAKERVIVSRDPFGVVPLYYASRGGELSIASEAKALVRSKPRRVNPGETIEFDFEGRIKKRRKYDPISLHQEEMDPAHLKFLFNRAVARRVLHVDHNIKTTIALSGGLDSSMVLVSAVQYVGARNIDAIVVCMDESAPHVENCKRLCAVYGVELKVVKITRDDVLSNWDFIRYHLEDYSPNVIKVAAMIRNYFVAKNTDATVILCGEGADELGGGYPPHWKLEGIALAWKCFSTLRSMHAINLDRVNLGGMAFTKEYRVPFLDRALVLYTMGCEKPEPNKYFFRRLAASIGVPSYILVQGKYNEDDFRIRALTQDLLDSEQRSMEREL